MHWADINAALYKAGSSPSRIAADEGTDSAFVARVIRGKSASYRIATAISATTNIPMNRMWPGRYDHNPRQARARRVA
jgi:lambda repressor-like predicted transcriptional regulator